MMSTFSAKGMLVEQQQFQQILLRGKGDGGFAEVVNKEISLLPPSDNLRMVNNEEYLLAKQSFDQWSLIFLKQKSDKEMVNLISAMNKNEEILASDYSNTTYFEITGENKNHYLNKLTHFDLRQKKFPVSTMAQTLIARIECCVYNLKDKYLVSCHSSYEDYIKARLQDNINL
jgi:heterotetrameric sarcosine oxidase gamma subunit